MTCPVCGANTEQITSTIYGMNVVCPTCVEYGITGSVLSMDQWQRLESQERSDALNKAKASARPGACPMITSNLLVADADSVSNRPRYRIKSTLHRWRLFGPSVPNLTTLPLHGDAGGIADLDPDAARAGLIRGVYALGNDALSAKPTSVREDDRAVLGCVAPPCVCSVRTCAASIEAGRLFRRRRRAEGALACVRQLTQEIRPCC
jgi:hypothetical protein